MNTVFQLFAVAIVRHCPCHCTSFVTLTIVVAVWQAVACVADPSVPTVASPDVQRYVNDRTKVWTSAASLCSCPFLGTVLRTVHTRTLTCVLQERE